MTEHQYLLFGMLAVSAIATFLLGKALINIFPDDFLIVKSNERSNHKRPQRQLGGLAIFPVTIAILLFSPALFETSNLPNPGILFAISGAFFLGLLDDLKELPVSTRLIAQFLIAILLVTGVGWPALDFEAGAIILFMLVSIAAIYWINAVNFMDGLDWMIVSGLTLPLIVHSLLLSSLYPGNFAVALLGISASGALLGFAFWNKPPAQIFLGDSGSLFLGCTSAVFILTVAKAGYPLIAVTPFLYFIADTLIAIFTRLAKHENIFTGHSTHGYQLAFRAGMGRYRIAFEIFLVNLILAGLAIAMTGLHQTSRFMLFGVAVLIAILFVWRLRKKG